MMFTWKRALGVVAVVIAIAALAGFAWLKLSQPHVRELVFQPTDYTGWQTYHDDQSGMTIKYPPGYQLEDEVMRFKADHPEVDVAQMSFSAGLEIYKTQDLDGSVRDKILDTSTEKQPLVWHGTVYTSIQDYYKSNKYYHFENVPGELVSLNGQDAIYVPIPSHPNDGPGAGAMIPASENYYILKNDHIINISILADSPYHDGILQSIVFNH